MTKCRICGKADVSGTPFAKWVRDTFTNHDLLRPGDVICDECAFWFEQKSEELQRRMGKDKPQRMQNYTHFIIGGEWVPVSKGDKRKIAELLLGECIPEMAAIAVSGQKHVAFRARRNPPGAQSGWVQMEERAIWVDQRRLRELLAVVERLYAVFSKQEIETGKYSHNRILAYGLDRWQADESVIKPVRKTDLFALALFISQRSEDGDETGDDEGDSGDDAQDTLARDSVRVQKPLPDDNLGAVSKSNRGGGLHKQHSSVCQLDLFEDGNQRRQERG